MTKVTKVLGFIVLMLLMAAASRVSVDKETSLERMWVSNKPLTLANMDRKEKLPSSEMGFIENNLGKMTHIYKGSKLTIVFEDVESDMFFRISEVNEGKISIETYEYIKLGRLYLRLLPISNHVFERIGKCIVVESWRFNEYFCK